MTTETITTLDDIVKAFPGYSTARDSSTYRSFNVTYADAFSCTVQIGFWDPHLKLFTPDKQLVLREDALHTLIGMLQTQLDRMTKRETWVQYIARILTPRTELVQPRRPAKRERLPQT